MNGPQKLMSALAVLSVLSLSASTFVRATQTHDSQPMALSSADLTSTFGAGGGGGSTPPPPPPSDSGGGGNGLYCQYNFDYDGYCDQPTYNYTQAIIDSQYGLNKRLWASTANQNCPSYRAVNGKCTGFSYAYSEFVSHEYSGELSAQGLVGAAIGVSFGGGYQVEVGKQYDLNIGQNIELWAEAIGTRYNGGLRTWYADYGDGPRTSNLTYAFPVNSGVGRHPTASWSATKWYSRTVGYRYY